MRAAWLGRLTGFRRDDGGQVLPLVCVAMVAMLGMAGFALDIGHAVYTSRELQATTDADSLAAAQAMTTTGNTMTTINGTGQTTGSGGVVASYSAVTDGYNARVALPSVTVTSTMKCLTTLQSEGVPCIGSIPYNAIQVTQTSIMPTFFGGLIGHKTMNLSSTSTSAIRGGSPKPSNIALIMDTTLSMNEIDTNCVVNGVTQTQGQCALNGMQALLKSLSPCGNYQGACATGGVVDNPFHQVALFTFPGLTTGTYAKDTTCTTALSSSVSGVTHTTQLGYYMMPPSTAYSGIATATAFSFPTVGATSYAPSGSTYQLTGYLSDYRTSNAATALSTTSALVKAAGGDTGCGSMLPPNFAGVYGTYYAGVIYAAQASLVAQKGLYPNTQNVIILLSDGDSNAPQSTTITTGSTKVVWPVMPSPADSSGNYPSYNGQCGQAVTAAKAATAAGTIVYTVSFGPPPTGCSTDSSSGAYPGITPCDAMTAMASSPQTFYSDWTQSGSGSTCVSTNSATDLGAIFQAISQNLSVSRLIPNGTT